MKDANEELYTGCKNFSKLSFLLDLYHIKCHFRLCNKSFGVLLKLLKDEFLKGETIPS